MTTYRASWPQDRSQAWDRTARARAALERGEIGRSRDDPAAGVRGANDERDDQDRHEKAEHGDALALPEICTFLRGNHGVAASGRARNYTSKVVLQDGNWIDIHDRPRRSSGGWRARPAAPPHRRPVRALDEELRAVLALQPARAAPARVRARGRRSPLGAAGAVRRARPASSIAPCRVRALTTTLISATAGGYRIARRNCSSSLIERRVVLAAGVLDAVVVRDRASARSPRRGSRRGRRGRPPASAAGTSAPPARKSASPRPTSAEITPTSVTRGKSCPLAIICVPTSTSISPAREPARAARRSRRAGASCRDRRRATRAPGNARRTSASTRSVPKPTCSRYGPAQLRARLRHARRVVAVVAARAAARASVHGQRHAAVRALERRAALPAEHGGREAAPVEQHDRLLAPRQPRRRCASRSARLRIDVRALRRRTPRACRRSSPSASGRSSTRRSSVTSVVASRSARCGSSPSTASPSRARRARRPGCARTTATSRPW